MINQTLTKLPTESVEPLQQHPSEAVAAMTPTQAQDLFRMKVSEIERESKCDYGTAFNRAKILNKQIFDRIGKNIGVTTPENIQGHSFTPPSKNQTALANDMPAAPIFSPQIKASLGLPGDADAQECETAWKATRGMLSPRDSQAIWKMLSALWQGRMSNKPKSAVNQFMTDRFPTLAAVATNTN